MTASAEGAAAPFQSTEGTAEPAGDRQLLIRFLVGVGLLYVLLGFAMYGLLAAII